MDCFFVDLDETLIASPDDANDHRRYPTVQGTPMLLRPHAMTFLRALNQCGPTVLYTSASRDWAEDAFCRFGLHGFFHARFHDGEKPNKADFEGFRNFLVDDQAITRQDIIEDDVSKLWIRKAKPFGGDLVPVYVAPFSMAGIDPRPNLPDALCAIQAWMEAPYATRP